MNFIELAKAAYAPNISLTDQRMLLDQLYTALFSLDEWLFSSTMSANGPTPFVSEHDNKQWLFAFTDSSLLEQFIKDNDLTDQKGPDGKIIFLAIPRMGIVKWLEQMGTQHIAGVQFNFAGPGWFVPMENFKNIVEHLGLPE